MRHGFTYTVLSTDTGDVIGCVYIYPLGGQEPGTLGGRSATVRSWVRADRAALDSVQTVEPQPPEDLWSPAGRSPWRHLVMRQGFAARGPLPAGGGAPTREPRG